MRRERLPGDMRQVLQLLLATPGRAAHPLAEPDERVDHDRRAGHADERESRIVVKQDRGVRDECHRLTEQVAQRLGHDLLNPVDVVGRPRHQPAGGVPGEEPCRLPQDVTEQVASQIADQPLPHVGHQVDREIRPNPLGDAEAKDRRDDPPEPGLIGQDLVEDRLE